MTNILIFGAGKSSPYLIDYLIDKAAMNFWQITVCDFYINAALERIAGRAFATAVQLDIHNDQQRKRLVEQSDFVISLLPPSLHILVAKDCILYKKNLATASYVSDEIQNLHIEARNNGLLFMNEIGLDPGIDHMSAMKIIQNIEKIGADIFSFKSYCGGLIAPESDTNPWHYKISWNPANIINAGKSGAHYILNGFDHHIPYERLFNEVEMVNVPTLNTLAAYANRDSVKYKSLYGLQNIKTMLRATFRYPQFCKAWHIVVQLQLTDTEKLYNTEILSYKQWFVTHTQHIEGNTLQEKLNALGFIDIATNELLYWLALEDDTIIGLVGQNHSSAILQKLLEEKWKMQDEDIDMIVMQHDFIYGKKNIETHLTSTLIVKGKDKIHTAMAKTVGLPLAIFTRLFLTGKIKNLLGVQIPITKEVYHPILKELIDFGIEFDEHTS